MVAAGRRHRRKGRTLSTPITAVATLLLPPAGTGACSPNHLVDPWDAANPTMSKFASMRALPGDGKKEQGKKERVRVHCRIRPLNSRERADNAPPVVRREDGAAEGRIVYERAAAAGNKGETKAFAFDSVFGPEATQKDVYARAAQPVVQSFLDGYNGTVFAYGQTGTGKTHTMLRPGGGNNAADAPASDDDGVIPRALRVVFGAAEGGAAGPRGYEYTFTLSYIQIYCEVITDLLVEPAAAANLMVIVGIFNTIGRIGGGKLGDKFGALRSFGFSMGMAGVFTMLLPASPAYALMVLYSAVFGFCTTTRMKSLSGAIMISCFFVRTRDSKQQKSNT